MKKENIRYLIIIVFSLLNFVNAKTNNSEINHLLKNSKLYSYNENISRFNKAILLVDRRNNTVLKAEIYLQKAAYLYNEKKYIEALNDYIIVNNISKKISNNDLYYYSLYGIALIKNQLEEYKDASKLLEQCLLYFEDNIDNGNNRQGYINTLGRLSYINLKLNNIGESYRINKLEFNNVIDSLDLAYAIKNKGLIVHYSKDYDQSIELLLKAEPIILKNHDYSWLMIIHQYLGENYLKKGNIDKATFYYNNVVKNFKSTKIVNSEIRLSFERLIELSNQSNNKDLQLKVINDLLLYDKTFFETNKYLSKSYFIEFENSNILKEKKNIENESKNIKIIFTTFSLLITIVFLAITYSLYKKNRQKQLKIINYIEQLKKNSIIDEKIVLERNISLDTEIEEKLNHFEKSNLFLNSDLTISEFSKSININRTSISNYINLTKNKNFTQYLNELRINYITQRLINERELRVLTIDSLAEKAGFNSRKTFSDVFLKHTGFRPSYFIKNLKD